MDMKYCGYGNLSVQDFRKVLPDEITKDGVTYKLRMNGLEVGYFHEKKRYLIPNKITWLYHRKTSWYQDDMQGHNYSQEESYRRCLVWLLKKVGRKKNAE